jgi:hypothetical protein
LKIKDFLKAGSLMKKKQNIFNLVTLTTIGASLILFGCKKSTNSEEEIILPESDITYFKHIQKLFGAKCATPGCHTYLDRAGDLDLTNYPEIMTKTVQGELIVIPEFGEQSFLYIILMQNYKDTPKMPLDGPYLNSNNTEGVKIWIDEGAKP